MSTTTPEVDLAETGGTGQLTDFVDEGSLKAETDRAAKRNRAATRPYRQYQAKVIRAAGVPNVQDVRQMTSNICGAVARLPFVPSDEAVTDDGKTEFDEQAERIAKWAEEQLNTQTVWTSAARALAREALKLRKQDPDGKKGIAWVNDLRLEEGAGVLDE